MFMDRIIESTLALPRSWKRIVALIMDAGLIVLTVWFAFFLRLGVWESLLGRPWRATVVALATAIPLFVLSGMYRAVFRYVSWQALVTIARAVIAYGMIYTIIFTLIGIEGVPRTIGIIQPVLMLIALGASRAIGRYFLTGSYREHLQRHKKMSVLIYGAGAAGRQLSVALSGSARMRVVGFVDDARDLQGSVIGGHKVWAPAQLEDVVAELGVEEIFLALPSAERARRNQIIQSLRSLAVSVRTLPGMLDLAHGRVTVSDIRPLEIDDLLGREPVGSSIAGVEREIAGRTILITGAGGSIGGELCRQILALRPERLLLVDVSEFALFSIHQELSRAEPDGSSLTRLIPLLGSVCDEIRMRRLFETYRPDIVFHAAAYKHVTLVEQNIIEGVRNNVIGTCVCAQLAREFDVDTFVLVSTDKAVRPTNVMGASKRGAELVLQAIAAEKPNTRFVMVRFGNVLGSSGSVVPLFRQQIAAGGPVTVTDREVTRYFMTIPEAAQLVLQAGAMADGGEVFVLDMGQPVKILDLARRMIELSGLKVREDNIGDGDITIEFTGLRPGEKRYEELLIGENPMPTAHPRIMTATENHVPLAELLPLLNGLRMVLERQDSQAVRLWLEELVPEYDPHLEIVDWTFKDIRNSEHVV